MRETDARCSFISRHSCWEYSMGGLVCLITSWPSEEVVLMSCTINRWNLHSLMFFPKYKTKSKTVRFVFVHRPFWFEKVQTSGHHKKLNMLWFSGLTDLKEIVVYYTFPILQVNCSNAQKAKIWIFSNQSPVQYLFGNWQSYSYSIAIWAWPKRS